MPNVYKYTPSELAAIAEDMKRYPPEQVQRDYLTGQISLKDKVHFLQLYGTAQKEIAVRGDVQAANEKTAAVKNLGGGGYSGAALGEAKYYWQNVANEFKSSWAAAGEGKKSEAVFRSLMGAAEVTKAFDVPGDVIERWILEAAPDQPGLARAANWAAWGVSNFGGLTSLLKLPFKAAAATARGAVKAGEAISNFKTFVKDPVAYAVKEARAAEAVAATKLSAEKGAQVASAAAAGEAKAGATTAVATAAPQAKGALVKAGEQSAFQTPQDLENLSVTELIKHYETRANDMVRKGVSHADTQAAATVQPTSLEDIVKRGPDAPISATELESIGRVHKQVSDAFNAVVDEAAKNLSDIRLGKRPDLVMAYKSHLAAMEVTNPAFLSARGQAGRSLEYLKTMQDLVGDSRVFDTLTRSLAGEKMLGGSDDAIAYTIQKVAALGKAERDKLIGEASTGEFSPGTLRLAFKSLLFARPGIHVANIAGNVASIALHGANETAAALMPGSGTTLREAGAYWSGMWDARQKYLDLYQRAVENQSKGLVKSGIEGSPTGKMVEHGPLGWLGFEDEIMGGVVQHGLAKKQAITEGLAKWDEIQQAAKSGTLELEAGISKKKFLDEFVNRSMEDPGTYERLLGETEKDADYILFHSPLSRGGEQAAKMVRETWLDYMAPVVKFPINAMKMARDWTPGLQMFSKDFLSAVAEGGVKADMARSRMALSWMISSQVYEAALRGDITGSGPTDPKAYQAWIAAGNKPDSIHGVQIGWVEPFGTWFRFVADLAHAKQEMTDDNLQNAFMATVMAGTKAVENNYWLRIMESVTNAVGEVKAVQDVNDILGSIGKVLLQPVKTIAQGGTVGGALARSANPEIPDQRFYGELGDLRNWFFAGTPWGQDTRPKLNFSGKVSIAPPPVGTQWLKDNLGFSDFAARAVGSLFLPPMRESIDNNDPVGAMLDRRGLTLHDNWKYDGGTDNPDNPLPLGQSAPRVNYSGDQSYNWKTISLNDIKEYGTNRTWTEAMQALDKDPRFDKLSKIEQQQEINRLYVTFRNDGKEALQKIDPDLAQKYKQRDALDAERRGMPPQPGPVEVEQPAPPESAPESLVSEEQ